MQRNSALKDQHGYGPSFFKECNLSELDFSSRTQASALCLVMQQLLQCMFVSRVQPAGYLITRVRTRSKKAIGAQSREVCLCQDEALRPLCLHTDLPRRTVTGLFFRENPNTSMRWHTTRQNSLTRHHRREDEREGAALGVYCGSIDSRCHGREERKSELSLGSPRED